MININALLKIIIGIFCLMLFWPNGYLELPMVINWLFIILTSAFGIKLIFNGINDLEF
jgi:hypothetical protein